MIGRDRIRAIFSRRAADRVGYWSGSPHPKTAQAYKRRFRVSSDLDLAIALGDDAVWLPAEWDAWRHSERRAIWPFPEAENWIGFESRVLASAESVADVEAYDWPTADHFDFSEIEARMIEAHRHGLAVFGGPWCSISTDVMNLFGIQGLLLKMYTHPAVVEAAVERIADFYLGVIDRFFEQTAELPEVFFFASDLGSQEDLLMSPEMFRRFFRPALARIADAGRSRGLPVMLHSCGAVSKIIPDFIDMGIAGLHPLQAKAAGMDGEHLAEYRHDLVFVGGVDTQEILPNGSEEEIAAEVVRLRRLFGEWFVVSPSHEALLPNVPLENVVAMRQAAVSHPHWRVARMDLCVPAAVSA